MLVCEVALGNVQEFTRVQSELEAPSPGFHSVKGVAGPYSAFKHDEHVVYQTPQQRLQYLVEFKLFNEPGTVRPQG